jgi:FkbM family methyltransferase
LNVRFFLKKGRLLLFLARRIPRFGWSQFARGMREREVSYLAMDLARILPSSASTIVDVGAHSGLVPDALDFLYGPRRIWAVEPNPSWAPELERRFKDRPQFVLVHKCLGESSGEVTLNVYDFDAATSLYACKAGHLSSLGLSEHYSPVKVPGVRLSELLPGDVAVFDLVMLDCQGAELSALRGAGSRLNDIRWIYCEVSIDPIYEGAPLFGEVHAFLRSAGFELRHLGGFSGVGTSIQWADALYANLRLASN